MRLEGQLIDQLTRETTIAAPPGEVWALLTDPQHLAAWWCSDGAEVDLRAGGSLVFRWREHGTFHARITALEPPRHLAFRWALLPDEEPTADNATEVVFTLAPDGKGTRLRVVETGFTTLRGTDADREEHLTSNRQGWEDTFTALADYARQRVG
jgi:uncharacterized protein YndB with AHSA1/START domain